MPRSRLPLVVVIAALAVAGCGDMSRAELKRRVDALNATAVEGRLVADGVASDRTRSTFARVHARTLAEDAEHEAEKMADASPQAGIEQQRDQAVEVAMRLDDTLGELEVFPGGERRAAEVRDRLASIADELERLAERLKDVP